MYTSPSDLKPMKFYPNLSVSFTSHNGKHFQALLFNSLSPILYFGRPVCLPSTPWTPLSILNTHIPAYIHGTWQETLSWNLAMWPRGSFPPHFHLSSSFHGLLMPCLRRSSRMAQLCQVVRPLLFCNLWFFSPLKGSQNLALNEPINLSLESDL